MTGTPTCRLCGHAAGWHAGLGCIHEVPGKRGAVTICPCRMSRADVRASAGHPAWCAQQHAGSDEHRSLPLLVLLPHGEQVTAVLAEDIALPGDPVVEVVHSDQSTPATHPLDPNAVTWLTIPVSHLPQLAGALSELATQATPGGTQ